MATFKKKDLNELVGGDFSSGGGDRNATNDSEIETGPVQKPYNDTSDYEKGVSLTSDKVTSRYRQDIPWFANYTVSGVRNGFYTGVNENKNSKIITKEILENKINEIIKKANG